MPFCVMPNLGFAVIQTFDARYTILVTNNLLNKLQIQMDACRNARICVKKIRSKSGVSSSLTFVLMGRKPFALYISLIFILQCINYRFYSALYTYNGVR
jgi:hypothetical protein